MVRVRLAALVGMLGALLALVAHGRGCPGAGGERQHRGHRPGHDRRRAAGRLGDGDEHGHGTARTSITNDEGVYRAILLPLGRYRVVAELQGFKTFEQQGITLSAGQTALINVELGVGSVSETVTVTSESPIAQPGKIDLGPDDRRERDPEPAARLAQPVQLRVPPGQRHRLREQRVRRAAHQRQRLADAHQLPARRQHEHREGSRRPAPAAGVRSARARSEGHHQRVRAGVRPDDRHGLQRHHAVGHQQLRRLGELPLQAQRHVVAAVLPRADGAASRTPRPTTSRVALGGPIVRDKCALLRRVRVRRPQPDHGRPGHHRHARGRRRRSASRCRRTASFRRTRRSTSLFGKTDYQINAANRLSARYFLFKNFSLSNIGGGLTTTDRATDFTDRMDSASAQLDLDDRHRHAERAARAVRAAAPVPDALGHGGRRAGDHRDAAWRTSAARASATATPSASTSTRGSGRSSTTSPGCAASTRCKAGIDAQFIADDRVRGERFLYTFPTDRRVPRGEERREPVRLHHRCSRTSAI